MGEGPWQELSWDTAVVDNATTFVSSPGITVTGVFVATDPEHWVPDASTSVLANFSGFVCKVVHPSEAEDVKVE